MPAWQIAENAGREGAVIVNEIKHAKPGFGFDAAKGVMADMVKSGILDPKKSRAPRLNPPHPSPLYF